ncbi:MAG: hypothetical protein Kow0091_30420 [Geminocystis sp.]
MEGNHKYLHYQDLKEYYHCLKIIDDQINQLSSAKQDLYWCESKLQEAQELVKPFGFTNQSINNLPQVNFYSKRIEREKVQNILQSITKNGEEILKNEQFIIIFNERINSYVLSKPTLAEKLKQLTTEKLLLQIGIVIYSIVYVIVIAGLLYIAVYVLLFIFALRVLGAILSGASKR